MEQVPLREDELAEVRQPTSLLIAQFFLFPLIIIAICVGIFVLFGYITYEQRNPREYLNEIRTGSGNRRWQAAFELSSMISSGTNLSNDPAFISDVITVYKNSADDDPRVRQFLAATLGQLGDARAVPVLVEAVRSENANLENLISTLLALGTIGNNAAVPEVLKQLKHNDPAVRQVSAFVLGAIKDPSAARDLQVALNDVRDEVRWYAAIALAQIGDPAGAEMLMKLLDPAYLDSLQEIRPQDRVELKINAVKSLGLLKFAPAQQTIAALSVSDPDLAVRDASIEALKQF